MFSVYVMVIIVELKGDVVCLFVGYGWVCSELYFGVGEE